MEQRDVVVQLAVTLDGYIARSDGTFDYLDSYPCDGFDFGAFTADLGAIVMGSASYADAVRLGWMWHHLPTLVLTSQTGLTVPDGADVTFENAPTPEAVRRFHGRTTGRLWVFGGGPVVTAAINGGVVDTLDLVVVPEALGAGFPLFTDPVALPREPAEATPYSCGAVRLLWHLQTPIDRPAR